MPTLTVRRTGLLGVLGFPVPSGLDHPRKGRPFDLDHLNRPSLAHPFSPRLPSADALRVV